jgi:voltage-gated potassium channel
MSAFRKMLWGALALVAIIAIGTIGYELIEGWNFLDALFMTVTTITTVGFSEVHPLSTGGRIFTIFLIIGGVGGALYALTGIIQYLIEGNIGTPLGRQRMKNRIGQLKGHFILCGFGRVGEEIARTFQAEGKSFVIIENRAGAIARLETTDYLFLNGDATRDEVLKEAGIEQAYGLVAAVGTDADNTYIVLSARGLHPDLFIEARACSKDGVSKLERAGANRVIWPEAVGAQRMAMLAMRPAVADFIDTIAYSHGREIELENVHVGKASRLVGRTFKDIRRETGIAILARKKKTGALVPNPADEEAIEDGEQLIVIGTKAQLAALEEAL